jgi:polyisoprenyl-phosphate glycosyltransferase
MDTAKKTFNSSQRFRNSSNGRLVSGTQPVLSIVIPAYNEQSNIPELYLELAKVLSSLNLTWETVFVDDGSQDRTWEAIIALHRQDSRVKGIRLTRNFGHQYALFAGLTQANGNLVISMDADLQHPPDVIPRLLEEWSKGNKVVHTVRIDNGDLPLFKKYSSQLFYKVFSFLSGVKMESGMSDFRLLDREVVDVVVQFREVGLFLRGIVQWLGYPNSKVVFQARGRFSGNSKFTFTQMFRFASDGITSFSVVPLRICTVAGVLTSTAAFAGILYACYSKFVTGSAVPGWASEISIISFLFGMLFIFLGLIGEYLGRIFIEVRGRPRFFVGEQVGIDKRNRRKVNAEIPRLHETVRNVSESR